MGCPDCWYLDGYHEDWCENHPTQKCTALEERIEQLEDELTAARAVVKEARDMLEMRANSNQFIGLAVLYRSIKAYDNATKEQK